MIADLNKVKALLEQVTAYRISKETGIAQTTISAWNTGKVKLDKISFAHAAALTKLHDELLGGK
jgi:hypothetical protein